MHENEGVMRMTRYRVCLDCDRMIPVEGDAEHQVAKYDDGTDLFIGCEGYYHKVDEALVTGIHEEE